MPDPNAEVNIPRVEKNAPKPAEPPKEAVSLGQKEKQIIDRIDNDGDEDQVLRDIATEVNPTTKDASRLVDSFHREIAEDSSLNVDIDGKKNEESPVSVREKSQPFVPLDPEMAYQKALDEVRSENDVNTRNSFTVLKEHLDKPESADVVSQPTREFTTKDQLRHKLLALEAKRQGVKDTEGFERLVSYFETSLTDTEFVNKKYKADISADDKKEIIEAWQSKGFSAFFFEQGDGRLGLSADKEIPFNVGRSNIPVLKAFLDTGRDPVPLIEALKPNMYITPSSFLDRNNLNSAYDTETTKFIELLQNPNIENMLPIIQGMSSVPHPKWEFHAYDDSQTQADKLRELAAGDVSAYSQEFFDKVQVLAKAMQRDVMVEELPGYKALIENPDKLQVLTSVIDSGKFPASEKGFSVVDSLNLLEKDGLLKPLSTLVQSGVHIDRRVFGGYKSSYDSVTQAEVDQDLLKFIAEPSVQGILADQDRQAFAQILRKMNSADVSADLVDDLYDVREDLVALNSLIFPSLDSKYSSDSYDHRNTKIDELKKLLASDESRKILLSPEFRAFTSDLQKHEGFELQPQDFLSFNSGDILVKVYKLQEVIEATDTDPGISTKIIEDRRVDRFADDQDMRRLSALSEHVGTIRLLREHGINIDPEKLKDAAWIAKIADMPKLRNGILAEVPEENTGEWLDSAIKLPDLFQRKFLDPIEIQKIKQTMMTSEDIARVKRFGQLFSSSEFLSNSQNTRMVAQESLYSALVKYKGDPEALFTNGKPNVDFAKLLMSNRASADFAALGQVLDDEILQSFEGDSRNTLEVWRGLPEQLQAVSIVEGNFPDLEPEIIDSYKVAADLMKFSGLERINPKLIRMVSDDPNYKDFIVDGKPSRKFIDRIISQGEYGDLSIFLNEETLSQYSDAERGVFTVWESLPEDLQKEVMRENPGFPNVSADKAEKYRVAAEVIDRIRNSPSAEIKRLEKELIGQLWKLDNPQAALEEIIGIFEKNNLPLVGKTYRVFETIYDNPNTPGGTILEKDLSSKANLSPVLEAANPRQRREIIYRDLLSINVKSGNPQLRDYLEVLSDGENVVVKMEDGGASALSEGERQQIDHFFNKMDMLYTSSLFGRTIENRKRARQLDSSPNTSGLNPEDRLQALRRNFRVRTDQKLTDRLSEMFLKPTGYTNIVDVLAEMDRSKRESDIRNRQFAKASEGKIALAAGDRFKGISSGDIGNILERGIVAREYLGASAGSDMTPYDTDMALILEEDLSEGVVSAVSSSPSKNYGDMMLVVKDRGQFGTGNNQYESFASGIEGERHYGIRTGLPSAEIDAVIAQNILTSDYIKLDDLFITVAQNGQYIPVGTVDGTIIFTPEKFDEYRKTFDGVSEYSTNPITVKKVGGNEETYAFPEKAQVVSSTRSSLDQLGNDIRTDRGRVQNLSSQVRQRLNNALTSSGVNLRGEFDTSIYGAEPVYTGSTSRGTNVPGDYDFDLSLQLDPNDIKRLAEVTDTVKNTLKLQEDKSHAETDYIQVRAAGSEIVEGEVLDIDIGIGKRADDGLFASNDAVAQKLDSVRQTFGDETYFDVLANIVLAKKVLKEGHAYKKMEDGGMGGIGVENWILLHNGNVLDAFQSFWDVAHDESGNVIPYEDFTKSYKVFDAGVNIKFNRHDNFIQVLKPDGYSAMLNSIGSYLGYA